MRRIVWASLALATGLSIIACANQAAGPAALAFTGLSANGASGSVTTTALSLSFDADPTSLAPRRG